MPHATRRHAVLALLPLLAAAAACGRYLDVPNEVDPIIDEVFGTPQSIEQTVASGFQSCHNAVQTITEGSGALLPQMAAFSLEGYSAQGNFGVGLRVGIPRVPVANALGAYSIVGDFNRLALGARLAANALNALDQLIARSGTLGTPAQDLRARAFAFLSIGCHQGWLAMAYDSAGIVTPGMPRDSIPPLAGAREVMASAMTMFDSAIVLAGNPVAVGASGFPLPATPAWVSGNALSRDDFVRLIRSLRARFRAGVARTPAERAQVDWAAVIADVNAGITSDFMLTVGGTTGWVAGGNVTGSIFSNATPLYYGMADTSGGYDAWLAVPMANRDFFLISTPDRRWPQGTTRAAQQANSPAGPTFNSRPYISNRSTPDPAGHAWAASYYLFNRLQYIRNTGNSGAIASITRAEMDLLAAEGLLRAGNVAAATARIDLTRVARGQLPALSGVVGSATDQVPGGNRCVPRVPSAPSFTSTACGTVLEALKWEKRMETAFTGYGQWFFDSRGWGDLPENTALEFPVPYQELAARAKPFYGLGGGGKSSAGKGTYGF